jgi:hypothetical protein
MRDQVLFDLSKLDSESANFHLLVDSAQIPNIPAR